MEPQINPQLIGTLAPPVMEARRWLSEAVLPPDRPLLNLSQAAPVDPPPEQLRRAMADAALHDADAHLYGPVLGDFALREEIALQWSRRYGAPISGNEVAITAGCNQAFCAAIATVAAAGDEVLLPVPWYFNHKMWLDIAGIATVPVPCDAAMLPDPAAIRAAITPRTRALVLVSPNNPTGAEYPASLLAELDALCDEHGLALILDETYRDFHSLDGPPHDLFGRAGWRGRLIHLYSFSKVFRLTGHRVGAMIAGATRLAQAEKFLDTVAICTPRLGQIAALHGLRHLGDWVAGERLEILARRAEVTRIFAEVLPDWRLVSAGAYFAWVEPPFEMPSDRLAQRLVQEQSLLVLPGTMFTPADPGWGGRRALRIAFANADAGGLALMASRLAAFRP